MKKIEAESENMEMMIDDCRKCKKWKSCPCGKQGHKNKTSKGYSIGECKEYEAADENNK